MPQADTQHHNEDETESHDGHQSHHAHMAADFRRRFWLSLILTIPVVVLSPMLQALVGVEEALAFPGDLYVSLAFSTAIFFYGG